MKWWLCVLALLFMAGVAEARCPTGYNRIAASPDVCCPKGTTAQFIWQGCCPAGYAWMEDNQCHQCAAGSHIIDVGLCCPNGLMMVIKDGVKKCGSGKDGKEAPYEEIK